MEEVEEEKRGIGKRKEGRKGIREGKGRGKETNKDKKEMKMKKKKI